jgi:antitoxin HicB
MRSFVFHAEFEPGDKHGLVVTFPDVPEAITQGDDMADAHAMAEEALGIALLSYLARGLPLPKAKSRGRDLVPVAVAPDVQRPFGVALTVVAAPLVRRRTRARTRLGGYARRRLRHMVAKTL